MHVQCLYTIKMLSFVYVNCGFILQVKILALHYALNLKEVVEAYCCWVVCQSSYFYFVSKIS